MGTQQVVVGNEVVEFPDDMSDAQITAILKNQTAKGSFAMGLGEPFAGLEQLAGKAVEAVTGSEDVAKMNETLRLRQLADEERLATSRGLTGQDGFDWARLAGNVASPANLLVGGGASLAAKAPMVKAAVTGGASALTMPVVDEDYWTTKLGQVGGGTVLGMVGSKGVDFASRALNPLISASEKKLREMGVTPTVGQTLGGIVHTTEDFLAALPFVGQTIKNAKEDSYESFRTGVINKGLSKVDLKLPKGITGYKAIQYINDVKNQKYDEALQGTKFIFNDDANAKINQAIDNAKFDTPAQKDLFDAIIKGKLALLKPTNQKDFYMLNQGANEAIDGQAFKTMESELSTTIFDYSKGSPAEQGIAKALRSTLDSIKSTFNHQNPVQSSKLRRVDALNRDLTQIADASTRSQTGKFTPEHYNAAIKASAGGVKRREFGRGTAYNQEMATAGIDILGSTEGDIAAAAGKIVTGAAGGYGAFANPLTALSLIASTPAIYSKTGKKVTDTILARRPEVVKQVGRLISGQSPVIGGLVTPEMMRQYNLNERKKDYLSPFGL
jgi:hypothetical protein